MIAPMRTGERAAAVKFAVAVAAAMGACGETRGTLVITDASGTPWRPAVSATWQVQLVGILDTSLDVSVYEVDLFDTAQADLDTLHVAGRRVICYMSAGTFEPWRSDAAAFPPAAVGNAVADYPQEQWLDTRDAAIRAAMAARLDRARDERCDGVELSSLSPGAADTGFPLTAADALAYARFLAAEAHGRGLSAGLGGGNDLAPDLVSSFEWAFTQGCLGAGTCGALAAFVAAQKVVFAVEFGTAADAATTCPLTRQQGLNALIKNRSLDAFRVACP
jgi:hypothetical protein